MTENFEIIIGVVTLAIGINAVIFTHLASKKLSNPPLLNYIKFVNWSITSLILFSLWHTVRELFELKDIYGAIAEVPEYFFVALTYVLFLLGAVAIFKMSETYGFKDMGEKIAESLSKDKPKNKKRK